MIIWNQQSVQRIQAQLLIILILLPCGCRIHAEIESRQILLHGNHHLHKITSHLPIFRHEKWSYIYIYAHVPSCFSTILLIFHLCSSDIPWYVDVCWNYLPFTQHFPPSRFTPAPSLWARRRRGEFLQVSEFQGGDRLGVLELQGDNMAVEITMFNRKILVKYW